MDENYHSTHGAIQESKHVFIEAGLKQLIQKKELTIFEVGFGTGLNALLTLLEAESFTTINYISVEKYPLLPEEYQFLNYAEQLNQDKKDLFQLMHDCDWNNTIQLTDTFSFLKLNDDVSNLNFESFPAIDFVYFDAFAPNKQEGIWTKQLFQKIFDACGEQAIFVTYCAQGQVRRNLQEVGFTVERIPGPPGKREMIRARKEVQESI